MLRKMLLNMDLCEGATPTLMDELEIYKLSKPFAKLRTVYPCSICFIIQGEKSVYIGNERMDYSEGQFLISSVTMPAESELRKASKEVPYLGIIIKTNPTIISELLLELRDTELWSENQHQEVLRQHTMTEQIEFSLVNLLHSVQCPRDYKILGAQHRKELFYRILVSPIGYLLRNSAIHHAKAHKIAPLIQFIEHNYHRTITIQELTKRAGVSTTTLHELFKETTSLSPIQFVKKLRLHRARTLLHLGHNASESAFASGYSSAAQFSREFKREYGISPSKVRHSLSL